MALMLPVSGVRSTQRVRRHPGAGRRVGSTSMDSRRACHPRAQVTSLELSSQTAVRTVRLPWWHRAANGGRCRSGGVPHLLQRQPRLLRCAGMARPLLRALLAACGAARAYPHVSVYVRVCIPGWGERTSFISGPGKFHAPYFTCAPANFTEIS